MEYTSIYKVYGCDTGGYSVLRAEFLDLKSACKYAVANKGKIHFDLPEVYQIMYQYDPTKQEVSSETIKIEPAQIHYMNKI